MLADFLLAGITLVLAVATLLPLSRAEAWWIRVLDFPRLQLAVALLALIAAQLAWLDMNRLSSLAMLLVSAGCLAWQVRWIAPYSRLFPVETPHAKHARRERTLSLLVANVLTPNRNHDALLALIAETEPDVVLTVESDRRWQQRLDAGLADSHPHTMKCPLDNLYGMHVYSRLPLTDGEIAFLVENDVPSMHACATLPCGERVRLHFLHPAPPSPTENEASSERDAELIVVAHSVAKTDQPVIVAGDLNDVAWSETTRLFRKISGLRDPRVGRGLFNTFHAKWPLLRWPLDHLFHSEHFALVEMRRLPPFGSDHFAILTRLALEPSAPARGEDLDEAADADERRHAREKMESENVAVADVPRPGKD